MNGLAQRPLAVCTIRETYWNKAGTESPAVGGFIWRAAGHWLNFDQHSCSTSPFSFSHLQTGQRTPPPTGGDPGILATGPVVCWQEGPSLSLLSHYFIYHEIPTYGQWLFSCSANGGCSVWKIRSRQLNTGSRFVGFWYWSEKVCTLTISWLYSAFPGLMYTWSSVHQLNTIPSKSLKPLV